MLKKSEIGNNGQQGKEYSSLTSSNARNKAAKKENLREKIQKVNNYRLVNRDDPSPSGPITNIKDIPHKKWGIRVRHFGATPPISTHEEIANMCNKFIDPKEYESLTPEDDTPGGLTGKEKIILSNLVKRLQNDGLVSLVRLVQKDCPNSIKETEDNIEIILESLDRRTYLQMNRLISTFLKVKEKNQENLELKKNSKF